MSFKPIHPLKKIRKQAGLTGAEMAMMLETNPGYYRQIENGHAGLSENKIKQICEMFSIDREQLTTWLQAYKKTLMNQIRNTMLSHEKEI